MPFDPSERAFRIFTEAYGKAWSPEPKGMAVIVPPTDPESTPLLTETPAASRARSKRRLPSAR